MSDRPTNKEWVEHWHRLGPILEEIRCAELRHFNYEEQLPIIDALLQLGVDHAVPRPTSGLVEFQRILARAKRPNMESITITLPESTLRKLKELASQANVSPEELVRMSVAEWLQRPNDDFATSASYVLQKNAELYQRLKTSMPSKEVCCDMMRRQVEMTCEIHTDRYDCPDCLIAYSEHPREYGLIVHDGGHSQIRIEYCPWCGCGLSENT
jgi:hypothetical protein